MSEFTWSLLVIGIYRILGLLSGVLSIYLGYKLFMKGVYEKAGDLKASWGDRHLMLKQSAPGTFFAVFGVIVITVGIWKGIHISNHENSVPKSLPTVVKPATPSEQLQGPLVSPEKAKGTGVVANKTPQWRPVGTSARALMAPIFDDILNGKQLTDDQRKLFEQWLEDQTMLEKFWHQEANQPKDMPVKETMG